MPATIDITKIIELKNILEEKFESKLHLHDTCGGQYFSVENLTPSAKDYIEYYFSERNYQTIYDNDNEFHLERVCLC
ncbi:MAG: hypothetical protein K6E29_03845 [Cyanobacteria bacterium RUI128]|nr:hypothetical protein [Cyanobacteria bacterium RUI128]